MVLELVLLYYLLVSLYPTFPAIFRLRSNKDTLVPLTILFVIAKKRGWEARKSLRRASRRLTGKFESAKSRRQTRTQGVRMDSPRRARDRDLEKGKTTTNTTVKPVREVAETPKISRFEVESPVAKSWKSKISGR